MSRDTTTKPRRGGRAKPVTVTLDRAGVEKLFQTPMPHSTEAEMALLGSLLLDPTMLAEVRPMMPTGEVFYEQRHAAIYDALLSIDTRHEKGDLVQLMDALRDAKALEQVGGADYLVGLAEQVPSAANAPHYAERVVGAWRLRRLIDASGEAIHTAFNTKAEESAKALELAQASLYAIAESAHGVTKGMTLAQALNEAFDAAEERSAGKARGVLTGFTGFDDLTGGLQPGELVVIGARPSMGKTALGLNMAEQIAAGGVDRNPAPVWFFSVEMDTRAIGDRFIVAHSGVSASKLRRSMLTDAEWGLVIDACGRLAQMPLHLDANPYLTLTQMRSRARMAVRKHNVAAFFVDYLQLVTAPEGSESRQVEVSMISRGLKALARETNRPVVVMAQLNRELEREKRRPRMSDLRDSGSIEQDADVIVLLHREAYYHAGDPDWFAEHELDYDVAELIVAKQRNGETGTVKLRWQPTRTRFVNDYDTPSQRAKKDTKKKQAHSPLPPEKDDETALPY